MSGPSICDMMADPYNRERAAVKTLLAIRKIADKMDHCDGEQIVQQIDDLLDQCGYTHIPGGNG